jgi:group I intron endonuclease
MLNMNSGIYKITNNIDSRIYIGSAKNLYKRFSEHKRLFKNQKHNNKHLLNFVNKYGLNSISFEILEFCDTDMLQTKEQDYINNLQPQFNICKFVYRPPVYRNYTEEDIRNFAKYYNKGKSLNWIAVNILGDKKHRSNLCAIKNGKIYAEYSSLFNKRKYNQKGRILSKESREKISKGNKYKGKLKEKDILDIITKLNNKQSGSSIALEYNVHRSVIYNIKNGKTHKNLTNLIQK